MESFSRISSILGQGMTFFVKPFKIPLPLFFYFFLFFFLFFLFSYSGLVKNCACFVSRPYIYFSFIGQLIMIVFRIPLARDLTIEAATQASGAGRTYGTRSAVSNPKPVSSREIRKLLSSRHDRDILDGLRKVVAVSYRLPLIPLPSCYISEILLIFF